MNNKKEVKLSKFLSFVLRHKPEEINLELDKNGWADINELIQKSKEHQDLTFSEDDLFFIVKNNAKQRFMLSDDKTKVKANQGHSIQVELGLVDTAPPEYLYHGTAEQFIDIILKEGVKPMKRHDVHLSFSKEVANSVGIRHGKSVVLRIKTKQMHKDGFTFQCTANNVWLTKHIEPKYIEMNFS